MERARYYIGFWILGLLATGLFCIWQLTHWNSDDWNRVLTFGASTLLLRLFPVLAWSWVGLCGWLWWKCMPRK